MDRLGGGTVRRLVGRSEVWQSLRLEASPCWTALPPPGLADPVVDVVIRTRPGRPVAKASRLRVIGRGDASRQSGERSLGAERSRVSPSRTCSRARRERPDSVLRSGCGSLRRAGRDEEHVVQLCALPRHAAWPPGRRPRAGRSDSGLMSSRRRRSIMPRPLHLVGAPTSPACRCSRQSAGGSADVAAGRGSRYDRQRLPPDARLPRWIRECCSRLIRLIAPKP